MSVRKPRPGGAVSRAAAPHPGAAVARGPVARSARRSGARGQSTVEVVAILPLLATVALAVGHVLAAGLAHELAGHAAEAGAIAALRGADPREAVRASLPEWAGDRVEVRVEGRRVRVRLEPLAVHPAIADTLASTAIADAGPEAVTTLGRAPAVAPPSSDVAPAADSASGSTARPAAGDASPSAAEASAGR